MAKKILMGAKPSLKACRKPRDITEMEMLSAKNSTQPPWHEVTFLMFTWFLFYGIDSF
jgi:hypothetical protein